MVEVLKTGFYDSIQDMGRVGFQEYGVPYSGVMDYYAASLANNLLGNDENASVLEITMTGPTLKFHCNTAICVTGANLSPSLNEKPVELNVVTQITKDDILSFGRLVHGFRAYLAVLGGFKTETVYGSQSMYNGVTKKYKVSKNDLLPITAFSYLDLNKKHASIKVNKSYFETKILKVFKGPEFNQLSKAQIEILFSTEFTVSKNNNRMAYQMDQIFENNLEPIITSLVMPGTVQLTPAGKLIVLMRDCQTTGGYPRILQLEEKAIDVLSQKYTGQIVQLKLIPDR